MKAARLSPAQLRATWSTPTPMQMVVAYSSRASMHVPQARPVARPAHHAAHVPLAATARAAAALGSLVGAIAKRCLAATFATAEVHGRAIRGRVLRRHKLSVRLVRPIAKRLALALAASAPPVVPSRFNAHREWRIAGSNRCWHGTLLRLSIGSAVSIGRRAHPHLTDPGNRTLRVHPLLRGCHLTVVAPHLLQRASPAFGRPVNSNVGRHDAV